MEKSFRKPAGNERAAAAEEQAAGSLGAQKTIYPEKACD